MKGLNLRNTYKRFVYIFFQSPQRSLKLFLRNLTDRDTPARKQQIDLLSKELQSLLGENCRITRNFFERRNYSMDLARVPPLMETLLYRTTPTLVVQPQNEKDIAKILDFCSQKKLGVFPRGLGSFAFGGAVPTKNGIVVDCSPMMTILEIDPERLSVRVQPGARWADMIAKLEPYGLVPMTTPTSLFSTVAGWISTGGLGLDSYAYGSVFDAVLGVRVVRPDGTIEELNSESTAITNLFGTEGQFGILSEITLRVRPKPQYDGTCLLTFETSNSSFDFLKDLTKSDHLPSHVVLFDRESMIRENLLFAEHTGLKDPIAPEQDVAILHFETLESEQNFLSSLNGKNIQIAEDSTASRYLWADRYFPLKAQRIGPGLLGAEVVVPGKELLHFTSKVRKLARRFKVKPSIEVIVSRSGNNFNYLVIVSFSCDYTKSAHYALSLLLIQMMVRLATRYGGYPYGIGIWNSPFIKSKYTRDYLKRLKTDKNTMDQNKILNPHKFFKIKGRFFGIPALLLRADIFPVILTFAHFFSPVLGFCATLIRPKQPNRWDVPNKEDQGELLLNQSFQRCTSCGSCVSVCPAYHLTHDELVTGRTKLRMAEAMINGVELNLEEAHAPFQCLHCGLCEEVCQTRLPLRECYLVLEDRIENQYGSPVETIKKFIEDLDGRRDFISEVFGLRVPEWSPEEHMKRVPVVEKHTKELER